jgi:hypothetical protein
MELAPLDFCPLEIRQHSGQSEDVELLHYLWAFFVVVFVRDELLLPG